MIKLLRAGCRRYVRNLLVWIGIVVSIAVGLVCGYLTYWQLYFEDVYYMILPLVYAVVLSLIIGREFSDGIFRNKIVAGHSKGSIFLSEAILAVCAVIVMFVLTSIGFAWFNRAVFSFVSLDMLALIYLGVFLLTLAFACIFILVSTCISNKAVASIMNILLVLVIIFAAYKIDAIVKSPPFFNSYDENGNIIEGGQIANPDYVDGTLRDVLELSENVLPYGQFITYEEMLDKMAGLNAVEPSEYHYYEYFSQGVFEFEQEEVQAVKTLPFYEIGLIVVLLGSGYMIFRKRDFK